MTSADFPAEIQALPVAPFLETICSTLKSSPSHFLVLTAETAAGKSTAVPLALLRSFTGRILMLEPRKLAALAIAQREAQLLGEKTGQTAGYTVHLESCISPETRLEVITEAVLTRRLQSDPSLEGVSAVIIDEFHERSIHADLALAFLKEAMMLRDDLYVIVMSATIDTEKTAAYLGLPAGGTQKDTALSVPSPVISVPGRQFPVSFEYRPGITPAQAVMQELHSGQCGTILVFLPGILDIRRCASELSGMGAAQYAEILMLHSSVTFAEQKKVLEPPNLPPGIRRVILSSSLAETSLTVPGVTTVIDSGLARISRMNPSSGMEQLVTETESVFSASQRAGRAGRTQSGRCIRLWAEHDVRTDRTPPEILRTDIAPLVLECAQWGVVTPSGLSWLDPPQENTWQNAQALLYSMGCITADGKITPLGKAALTLGIHPRLACTALSLLFSDPPAVSVSIQCALRYSSYKDAPPALQYKFTADLKNRISRLSPELKARQTVPSGISKESAALFAGFPDRIARLENTDGIYRFPSGRMASLPSDVRKNSSTFPQWIIAPETDAGERTGRIYSYQAVSETDAEKLLAPHTEKKTETVFTGSRRLKKTEYTVYGKLVLSERRQDAEPADTVEAACAAVQENGISWLPLSAQTQSLLTRARFYQLHTDSPLCSDAYLALHVQDWLAPFITDSSSLTEQNVYSALYWYLDGGNIDRNVPEQLTLPNGRKRTLIYEQTVNGEQTEIQPVLEVIIQQIFGCMETPRIMGVPVLLKLLSPARRPLQITSDLAGFWQNTWPEVCREMKGRYPKHNWDYRVIEKSE